MIRPFDDDEEAIRMDLDAVTKKSYEMLRAILPCCSGVPNEIALFAMFTAASHVLLACRVLPKERKRLLKSLSKMPLVGAAAVAEADLKIDELLEQLEFQNGIIDSDLS